MTNSYDSKKDVYTHNYRKSRSPARDAVIAVADDAADLSIYGKLAVYNSNSSAEVIRVVPVAAVDDTSYVDIHCAPGTTVIDWLIVRAVRVTGTGSHISALVLTS